VVVAMVGGGRWRVVVVVVMMTMTMMMVMAHFFIYLHANSTGIRGAIIALYSSKTSVLTTATQCHTPDDGILLTSTFLLYNKIKIC
jgi:hypothetical protein